METLIALIILGLFGSGCGPADSSPVPQLPIPEAKVPAPVLPSPSPSPSVSVSPSPSPSPSCKPLRAANWQSATQPSNQLMGVYLGPPTNGPVYTLDLSQLNDGTSTFTYDSTHVCRYTTQLDATHYTLNFLGCNPGIIPPGHPVNEQCDYCPYHDVPNIIYNYSLACGQLTLQNAHDAQTIIYQ